MAALLACLLVSSALPALADGPREPEADTAPDPSVESLSLNDDPWEALGIVEREVAPRPLLRNRTDELADAATAPPSPRNGQSWVRTTGALAGVVALIGLLAWGYRLASGRGGSLGQMLRGGPSGLIQVVSRTTLAPRQSLCLVRMGPRLVLLGLTQDNVRTLDVIDDPKLAAALLGEAQRGRPDSSSAEFAQCLEREARGYDDEPEIDETVTPEQPRLLDIKEKLSATINRLRETAAGA